MQKKRIGKGVKSISAAARVKQETKLIFLGKQEAEGNGGSVARVAHTAEKPKEGCRCREKEEKGAGKQ